MVEPRSRRKKNQGAHAAGGAGEAGAGRGSSSHAGRDRGEPGAVVEIRVDSLAPGGDAVGRQVGGAHAGRATFVPLAAPGELVQARLSREKARVAWADLVAVTHPGPARVTAPCPYFGACGGCQWQHVALDAQRAAKRAIVERALGAAVSGVAAPAPGGTLYRDRARLSVGRAGEVGFHARRAHGTVDVERCLLLSPPAAEALVAIRPLARRWSAGTEIDLQAGNDGVHVAVRTVPGGAPPDAGAALASWRGAGVTGVHVVAAALSSGAAGRLTGRDPRDALDDPDVPLGAADPGTAAGAPDVDVAEPGSPPLRLPAGAFAQVGRAANAALVDAVKAAVTVDPGRVLELYAGSGNFTRHLVATGAPVQATDGDRAAVARGRRNAPGATWLDRLPAIRAGAADTVVVDPPRAGLDGEHLRAALGARRRLVYVSCDPQTLARDARRFLAEGFSLRSVGAFDLMPHTFHVEVVAVLDRSTPSGP